MKYLSFSITAFMLYFQPHLEFLNVGGNSLKILLILEQHGGKLYGHFKKVDFKEEIE